MLKILTQLVFAFPKEWAAQSEVSSLEQNQTSTTLGTFES